MRKMNWQFLLDSNQRGFTLIELLMSLLFLGVTVTFLVQSLSNQTRDLRSLDLKLRIAAQRDSFLRSVDCVQTLSPFRDPATGVVSCDSSFALKNSSGQALLDSTGLVAGGDPNWKFTASCGVSSIELTGSFYAGSSVVNDPLLGLMNASNPKINPMFGSSVAFKLCHHLFGLGARVESFKVPLATVSLSTTDCDRMSNRDMSAYLTEAVSPLQVGINKCSQFCFGKNFMSGFISHCTSSEATCECLR